MGIFYFCVQLSNFRPDNRKCWLALTLELNPVSSCPFKTNYVVFLLTANHLWGNKKCPVCRNLTWWETKRKKRGKRQMRKETICMRGEKCFVIFFLDLSKSILKNKFHDLFVIIFLIGILWPHFSLQAMWNCNIICFLTL